MGLLSACSSQTLRPASEPSPFVYEAGSLAAAQSIVFLLPGALTPLEIFEPVAAWRSTGYVPVGYRYPGMDNASLTYDLVLDQAAQDIADFAEQNPDKKIRILAYSTGGPIALMAASRMRHSDVKVAAMSPAIERAGGLTTALNGLFDIMASAVRARSVRIRNIWPEYYKTLLFGAAAHSDTELKARATSLLEQERARLVLPNASVNKAQTDDLKSWTVPDDLTVDATSVRFFIGLNDPVFTTKQTQKFAEKIGLPSVVGYPDDGHILFVSRPSVFDDIKAFFDE